MNPLVSIVIPCFNVKEYVGDAIASALEQTYSDVEIICVDNGSTDGTSDLLRDFEKKGQIILIEEARKGATVARNTGWRQSKGEWIQFLDADDIIHPEKISHQLSIVPYQNDVPFIAAGCIKKDLETGEEKAWSPILNPWHGLLQNRLGITTANLFCRRYLQKVDGWKEGLKSSQEYDLMFRIMQVNDAVLIDERCDLSVIRSRAEGSISSDSTQENRHRFLALMSLITQYMKKNKKGEFNSLNGDFFQKMFLRIRVNTYDGYSGSRLFYNQIMPAGFQPKAHKYTPPWFIGVMNTFGFGMADRLQRIVNLIRGRKVERS